MTITTPQTDTQPNGPASKIIDSDMHPCMPHRAGELRAVYAQDVAEASRHPRVKKHPIERDLNTNMSLTTQPFVERSRRAHSLALMDIVNAD